MTYNSVHGRGCEWQMSRGADSVGWSECYCWNLLIYVCVHMFVVITVDTCPFIDPQSCGCLHYRIVAFISSTIDTFIEESNKNVNTRSLNLFQTCVKLYKQDTLINKFGILWSTFKKYALGWITDSHVHMQCRGSKITSPIYWFDC